MRALQLLALAERAVVIRKPLPSGSRANALTLPLARLAGPSLSHGFAAGEGRWAALRPHGYLSRAP